MTNKRAVVPHQVQMYLGELELTPEEAEAEVIAYWKIIEMIEGERSILAKKTYQEALAYVVEESGMRLTYCLEHVFSIALKDQKVAKKKIQPIALFEKIERILSQATYTSDFGHSRRYPLRTQGIAYQRRHQLSRNRRVSDEALPDALLHSYYKFGVHSFRVGEAIARIMEALTERYGLDLKKLESEYQKKQSQIRDEN